MNLEDKPRGTYWPSWLSYSKCFKEKLPKDSTLSVHEISEICGKDPRETKKYLELVDGKDLGGRKIVGRMIPEKKYYVDPPAENEDGRMNWLFGLAILGLFTLPLWLPRSIGTFGGASKEVRSLYCPECIKAYALDPRSTVIHIRCGRIWFICDCGKIWDVSSKPNRFYCSCQRIWEYNGLSS